MAGNAIARRWLTAALIVGACAAAARPAAAPAPKILRYAFPAAETTFDPAQVSDLYSRTVIAGIFEAPLEFEPLAQPPRMRPNTAAAMPEVADDYRRFTFRLRAGIRFAADPAFGGRPRELTAADYVYAIKRHYDPRWKSGNLYLFESAGILGLSELRRRAIGTGTPFDYDAPVEGLRTLDRYTFEVRLRESAPRFVYLFADPALAGAVAREAVDAYGDRVGEHPVGTGPFRLASWRRSSRIVLERNPDFRELRYDEHPPAGDARLAAIAERLRGRRLPMLDRVEISVIEEAQPRWLAFLNGEHDLIDNVPPEFVDLAAPNGRLAPNLERRGVTMVRYPRTDITITYFSMDDPVVGGSTPAKVALRRAIALAVDVDREIRLVRHGQAIPAQSLVAPGIWGYDPAFRSEMSQYDPARAQALLDLYGYTDRDGDGWRDQPDGTPLVLQFASSPDQTNRQQDELWRRDMNRVGLRIEFRVAQWPEQLKAARAGKLMMWRVGWTATQPDADAFLALAYGPNAGQSNLARFRLAAYDAVYERERRLPDGAERAALVDEAKRLAIVYMPYKVHVHRTFTDLAQPWVIGHHRNVFVPAFWKYLDVEPRPAH